MRNRLLGTLGVAVVLLAASVPLLAHHGAAQFDVGNKVTLKGTVVEWFWANPHCFLRFDAAGDNGQVVRWAVETQSGPWVALDRLSLRLQSPNFDIQEMECSPSDQKHYYEIFGSLTGLDTDPAK